MSTVKAILPLVKTVLHITIDMEINTSSYLNEIEASISSISHLADIIGEQFISTESKLRNPEIEVEWITGAILTRYDISNVSLAKAGPFSPPP